MLSANPTPKTVKAPLCAKGSLARQVTTGTIADNVPAEWVALYELTPVGHRADSSAGRGGRASTTLALSGVARLTAGETATATLTFTNHGVTPVGPAGLSLATLAGWTVTPTSCPPAQKIDPGRSITATFAVTAEPGRRQRLLRASGRRRRSRQARVSRHRSGQPSRGGGGGVTVRAGLMLRSMSELTDPAAAAFAARHTTPFTGPVAAAAQWTADNASYPQMMAGLPEARLLEALIVISGARCVLEVGTFTGVAALTMAAALGETGEVVTLEVDSDTAETARRHFAADPAGKRITLIVGPALESLHTLEGPFDLVWIDAAKAEYPDYYEAIVDKLAPRGVIVADNLFRDGLTLDPASGDPGTRAMRAFAARVQEDERVDNVLLTVGDGLLLAWRKPTSTR